MTAFDLRQQSHRRFNPLTREWILVSPHRTLRPWQGKQEHENAEVRPKFDPDCYLCPGNTRAGGMQNPPYTSTYCFDNDFAALQAGAGTGKMDREGLVVAQAEKGICRVVCFSPRHDLDLPGMELARIREVIDVWGEQYRALGVIPWIRHVQIFENRGAIMGASNPHPHCQIWSNASLPTEVHKEQSSFREYRKKYGTCLLCRYLALELQLRERLVFENQQFAVLVPFWAVWPFETMVVAKQHRLSVDELSDTERFGLAESLKRLTARYDNLFHTAFPYSMGFHQKPTDGRQHPEWHLHAHFYPPLLRSAKVRKFMVGYELLANPQRDITPESAAERLSRLPDGHYRQC